MQRAPCPDKHQKAAPQRSSFLLSLFLADRFPSPVSLLKIRRMRQRSVCSGFHLTTFTAFICAGMDMVMMPVVYAVT